MMMSIRSKNKLNKHCKCSNQSWGIVTRQLPSTSRELDVPGDTRGVLACWDY